MISLVYKMKKKINLRLTNYTNGINLVSHYKELIKKIIIHFYH